ncbi:hypothetical protein KKE92_05165 [Candidatus Micrarchaeota archaeon]|nr:hypothetical protein [Candidatus Micrarchaeota archaeon]
MFSGFLGQFRPVTTQTTKENEPETTQKPPESQKSNDSESFLSSAKTKTFIKKWSQKTRDGKSLYTKRGVVGLLKTLFQNPGLESDSDVLGTAEELLSMLGGMDGLSGFLMGWKAKSEGIIKGLKSVVGAE